MILATNYQKFSKFVKVTAKILLVPFLLGHGVFGSVKMREIKALIFSTNQSSRCGILTYVSDCCSLRILHL